MYKKFFCIMMAVIFTGMISLSLHSIILQYFYAPEIKINPDLAQATDLAIRFCTVASSIFIYIFSKNYWSAIKLAKRVILFTILIMALTESLLRSTIMNLIVGNSLQSQFLLTVPSFLKFFILSCIICILASLNIKNNNLRFLYYLLLAVFSTTAFILLGPVILKVLEPVAVYLPNAEPNPINPPYKLNVLIPAYITYLEPTIASFILFYLIKDKLAIFNTLIKGLILGTIIALLHAGLYSVTQIIYSEGNIFYRIFYYGQFLWEYYALGIFTAYSYHLFGKQLDNT